MKNDVGPIKIHHAVFEISQVTFLSLMALFLLTKNKNANYVLISLGIGEKKDVFLQILGWGFQLWSQIFVKTTRKHSKISTKVLDMIDMMIGVLDFTAPYPKSARTNFPPTNAKMLRQTCWLMCGTMVTCWFMCGTMVTCWFMCGTMVTCWFMCGTTVW